MVLSLYTISRKGDDQFDSEDLSREYLHITRTTRPVLERSSAQNNLSQAYNDCHPKHKIFSR